MKAPVYTRRLIDLEILHPVLCLDVFTITDVLHRKEELEYGSRYAAWFFDIETYPGRKDRLSFYIDRIKLCNEIIEYYDTSGMKYKHYDS